jgi:hypothetical protein
LCQDPLARGGGGGVPSPEKRFTAPNSTSDNTTKVEQEDAEDMEEDEEDGDEDGEEGKYDDDMSGSSQAKGKRGRPRKHAPKIPLPPLYVFIRDVRHLLLLTGDHLNCVSVLLSVYCVLRNSMHSVHH